jgi:hypothetical protein
MTMAEERDLEKLSLEDLAELLSYYNLYDTTKATGKPRPSGTVLKKHIQRRLTRHGKDDPKPPKEPPVYLDLDLNVLARSTKTNLLLEIERELSPYIHNGHKALRRKPREYAREVVLALMENQWLQGDYLCKHLFLRLFEGNYTPVNSRFVECRAADWVVYSPILGLAEPQGITSTLTS